MVLTGECADCKALGGIIPETNAFLRSGLMGNDCCQVTGGKGGLAPGRKVAGSGATCQVCF